MILFMQDKLVVVVKEDGFRPAVTYRCFEMIEDTDAYWCIPYQIQNDKS